MDSSRFKSQIPAGLPAYSTPACNEDAIANLTTHNPALLIRIGHIATGAIRPLQQMSRPLSTTRKPRSSLNLSQSVISLLKHITCFTDGETTTKITRGSFLPNYRNSMGPHAPTALAGPVVVTGL